MGKPFIAKFTFGATPSFSSNIKFCTTVPVLNFHFGDVHSLVACKKLVKRSDLSDFLYFCRSDGFYFLLFFYFLLILVELWSL